MHFKPNAMKTKIVSFLCVYLITTKHEHTHVPTYIRYAISTVDIVESYSISCWQWSLVDLFHCFSSVASIVYGLMLYIVCAVYAVSIQFCSIYSKQFHFSSSIIRLLLFVSLFRSFRYRASCIVYKQTKKKTPPTHTRHCTYICAAIKWKHEIYYRPKTKIKHTQTPHFNIPKVTESPSFSFLFDVVPLYFYCYKLYSVRRLCRNDYQFEVDTYRLKMHVIDAV